MDAPDDTLSTFERLCAHPEGALLTELSLAGNGLGAFSPEATAAPSLARLARLDLGDNRIGDEGATALDASAALVGCRVLR